MRLYKRGRVWWVAWPSREPRRPHRRSTGCADKRAAEAVARRLVERSELLRVGLPAVDQDADLDELAREWGEWLASPPRERSAPHVAEVVRSVEAFLRHSGARQVEDLTREAGERWLASLREAGRSSRTANKRRGDLRAWSRWLLVQRRALVVDPFAGLDRVRHAPVPARRRRALSDQEADRLLQAAPWGRALLYRLALGTGLRRGELRQLQWRDLGLRRRLLVVRAEAAKSRREDVVPLPPALAELLARVLELRREGVVDDPALVDRIRREAAAGKTREAIARDLRAEGALRVDGSRWWWHRVRDVLEPTPREVDPAELVLLPCSFRRPEAGLYVDLARAGVERETREGRVDLHALRVTYGTRLRRLGLHPWAIQRLLRHRDPRLSATTYQAHDAGELVELVDALEGAARGDTIGSTPAASSRRKSSADR